MNNSVSNTTLIGYNLESDESNDLKIGDKDNYIQINDQGQFIVNGAVIHFDKKVGDAIKKSLRKAIQETSESHRNEIRTLMNKIEEILRKDE
jgi:hypothetical protein